MENKIFSVTVTYNPELELLNTQINSLADQVNSIVIVDNFSSNFDALKSYVEKKRESLQIDLLLIAEKKNMGLGYAQNSGIKYAMTHQATDVLLLDQDSVLQKDFMVNILNARTGLLDKGIKVGAIGPTYYNDVTNQAYPITKFWGPFIKNLKPVDDPVEASFLIASGCLISVAVLADAGLMNNDFFIDCIDVEWSFRVQAMGYKVFVAPKAKMTHIVGEKSLKIAGRGIAIHSPLRRYYLFRNTVFLVGNKNIPWGYKVREITFNSLRLIIYLSVSTQRMKFLKYSFNGLKDGLNGVGGECVHKF